MFNNLPPALKNLLIINVLVFFAGPLLEGAMGIDFVGVFGLRYFQAEAFRPFQLVTYMFLHANLQHLFFNMFGLFMFGRVLEQVWGSKRFLIFYFVTGVGAGLVQELVQFIELQPMVEMFNSHLNDFPEGGFTYEGFHIVNRDVLVQIKDMIFNQHLTRGASGAVFGVLLAFGMLFPNTEMYLMFIPIPIKAKYLVIGYGVFELLSGFSGINTGVAHFAHLGGMLFGFFLIRYWRKNSQNFY